VAGPADPKLIQRTAITLALSAGGGAVATWLGLPAGWVAGGLLTVAVASLAGVNTQFPDRLRAPVFLVLGIFAGGGVSEETVEQMRTWPGSFAILAVSMVALVAGSYWWLHRRCGWERNAAVLSALPGALSFVLAVAEGLKADMKKVAIAQSIRLIVLIEAIPLVALLVGLPDTSATATQRPSAGPMDLVILFAVAAPTGFIVERLHVPGGWLVGGMVATAALVLGGVADGALPAWLVIPFTVALAAIAGSRFRPGDLAILPRIAGPALVAFAIAALVSAAGAAAVTLIFGVSFVQTLMAFAPGAIEAVTILAYQMNVDPAYVAAHHVARFIALVAAVPLLARWLDRQT
jgi:membrane AbrB-like protein